MSQCRDRPLEATLATASIPWEVTMPADSVFFVIAVIAVFVVAMGAIAYAQWTAKD